MQDLGQGCTLSAEFFQICSMKPVVLFFSAALLMLGQGCDSGKTSQAPVVESVNGVPLAVPEPEDASRQAPEFTQKSGDELGLPFSISLPADARIKKVGDSQWRATSPDGSFDLFFDQSANDIQALKTLWESGHDGLKVRSYLLDTPYGFLVEAERDGKIEYHVEYLYFKVNRMWRFYTPSDKAFSRSQAEKMFHACRLLRGDGR